VSAKAHVLAIDQGTTSSRAVVFDQEWRIAGLGQREHPQSYPHSGWVEHDAAQIWSTQAATMREALEQAGIAPRELAAIGITNQRETTLLWDRHTGQPIGPAIVWQDRRTAERCAELLAQGHGPLIRSRTGLLPDSYFSAPKLEWLLAQVPGARARHPRRAGLWHHRQLADMEPDRRPRPCHRYQQRQPHHAVQYPLG
jgi:glycerol kinase